MSSNIDASAKLPVGTDSEVDFLLVGVRLVVLGQLEDLDGRGEGDGGEGGRHLARG